jgi:hypothetical protein
VLPTGSKQHLDAGQHDAKFVEKLYPLLVEFFFAPYWHVSPLFPIRRVLGYRTPRDAAEGLPNEVDPAAATPLGKSNGDARYWLKGAQTQFRHAAAS